MWFDQPFAAIFTGMQWEWTAHGLNGVGGDISQSTPSLLIFITAPPPTPPPRHRLMGFSCIWACLIGPRYLLGPYPAETFHDDGDDYPSIFFLLLFFFFFFVRAAPNKE